MKSVFYILFILIFSSQQISAKKHSNGNYKHPAGKYITVNGAKLWVETMGKGEPLFLIAGGPGNSHLYMHSFDALKDSFLLVFIDAFGRGKSDTALNAAEYTIERDVEDIEGLRKASGYEHFNLLGHSYGTLVAQSYALKYGQHLNHLILADGLYNAAMWQENDDNCNHEFSENDPEMWDSLMTLRKQGLHSSDALHHNLYFNNFHNGLLYTYYPENGKKFPVDTTYPNDFNSKLYYQFVGSDGDFIVGNEIAKYDVSTELKNLKMPVLIIAGRYDRISVPKFSILYKKYCPQATFVMFEHSGHWPQLEEPEKEFPLIRSFLKR
ncbi:MAG: Proline iminopeptidase [Bacteroidota bacterium]|nr:Proline iminopeptidase [Bacteroidota bacterium]